MSSPHTVGAGITIGQLAGDIATMTLTSGTLTSNGSVLVGDALTSSGTLNVNSSTAALIVSGATSDLTIGNNGDAALNITGLGHVQSGDRFIAGSNSASSPTITVSGYQAVFPFDTSFPEVLGSGESRIGQGGDATMTLANGGVARFAGHLIIANGSSSPMARRRSVPSRFTTSACCPHGWKLTGNCGSADTPWPPIPLPPGPAH